MIRFFQALMPREEKFFGLFDAHARTLVLGAEALRDLLEGGGEALLTEMNDDQLLKFVALDVNKALEA